MFAHKWFYDVFPHANHAADPDLKCQGSIQGQTAAPNVCLYNYYTMSNSLMLMFQVCCLDALSSIP